MAPKPEVGRMAPLRTREIVARAMEATRRSNPDINETDVVTALPEFHALWETMYPAEQLRTARLLIERVTVRAEGMTVDLRTERLGSAIRELVTPQPNIAA